MAYGKRKNKENPQGNVLWKTAKTDITSNHGWREAGQPQFYKKR